MIVQEGRAAAGGRSELFAPGSVTWPESGISHQNGAWRALRKSARSPIREPDGVIRVSAVATPAIVARGAGLAKIAMSPSNSTRYEEHRTAAGVREVLRALGGAPQR